MHWWYNFQKRPMFSFSCWKVYLRRRSNLHAETNIAKKMCMCLFHKWIIFYSFLPRSGIGVEAKCWTLRPGLKQNGKSWHFSYCRLEYFQHGSFMKFMTHHISSQAICRLEAYLFRPGGSWVLQEIEKVWLYLDQQGPVELNLV